MQEFVSLSEASSTRGTAFVKEKTNISRFLLIDSLIGQVEEAYSQALVRPYRQSSIFLEATGLRV